MQNIFMVVFFTTLSFACIDPYFFIGYLISMALFGLYQAIFMANAGGAWDNAKKIVETELKAKGTELHAATVVGDTVGDPFKDTSSVALNPVIKFTTLFGVLAVGLALELANKAQEAGTPTYTYVRYAIAVLSFLISVIFAWRSFYAMRIGHAAAESSKSAPAKPAAKAEVTPAAKPAAKAETKTEAKTEAKTEPEVKAEAKAETTPEAKTDGEPEATPEAKPDAASSEAST
jgi:K(+)-stimulated pyrophosphate-energized sodium pump